MSVGKSDSAPAGGKYLHLIYILVVMYAVCQQLQLPLEPFLMDKLVGKGDASAVAYGRLQSLFQAMQMIGCVAFGSFVDKFGVRLGLIVNFFACAASFALRANATSLTLLFLSKVPGVAFAGVMCSQVAVSHITRDGVERVVALGRLETAYALGGILGPAVGGRLGAAGDYYTSSWVATCMSLVAAGLCCMLPKSLAKSPPGVLDLIATASAAKDATQERSRFQRAQTLLALVGSLFLAKLMGCIANSMAASVQSLVLKNELRFSETALGLYISGQFAFCALVGGVLLAPLCRILGGQLRSIVRGSALGIALAYFGLAFVMMRPSATQPPVKGRDVTAQTCCFAGWAMVLLLFQTSIATSITAECMQRVPKELRGTLLGMEHGVFAAAGIVSPAIGISIFNHVGSSALYFVCTCVFAVVFFVWIVSHRRQRDSACAPSVSEDIEIALAS